MLRQITQRALTSALFVAALSVFQFSVTSYVRADSKLLFNLFVPPQHPFNTGIYQPWARRVALESNGRVKVEFSSASLGPPQKQWNLVAKGIADVTMLANPFERNRLILPAIATIPLLVPSAEKGSLALWRTYRKLFVGAKEYKGVRLLGLWANSGYQILHRDKPIRRVEDLKGQKMWALSAAAKNTMTAIGAVPVPVPGVEMFTLLSHGSIDGLMVPVYALKTFQLAKFIRHVTRFPGGLGSNSFSMIMNRKKFGALSAADQSALTRASGEKIARSARAVDDSNEARFNEHQTTIEWVEADSGFQSALRTRLAFVRAAWIKRAATRGVDGKAAIAYFTSQMN